MTITITLEELQKYEAAMKSWGVARAMSIENMMSTYNDPSNPMQNGSVGIRRAILDLDKNAPPPTLIPIV